MEDSNNGTYLYIVIQVRLYVKLLDYILDLRFFQSGAKPEVIFQKRVEKAGKRISN